MKKRVLSLVSQMDNSNLSVGNSLYVSTKYALARWVRRMSASWAANGVRINAVAPGNVSTAMTATSSPASGFSRSVKSVKGIGPGRLTYTAGPNSAMMPPAAPATAAATTCWAWALWPGPWA